MNLWMLNSSVNHIESDEDGPEVELEKEVKLRKTAC